MHPSARYYAKLFFDTYVTPSAETRLLEVGSQNVNGSLREVAPEEIEYVGVDMEQGDGVDILLTDPYALPFPNESFDVVVSSSCFEHDEFFWVSFMEALRVLKPHGVMYLNVPSNGLFHRYPVDCWRFYPDSGRALVNWARRCGLRATLLKSFVGVQQEGREGTWNDFVAVVLKDEFEAARYPRRILEHLRDFDNGVSERRSRSAASDRFARGYAGRRQPERRSGEVGRRCGRNSNQLKREKVEQIKAEDRRIRSEIKLKKHRRLIEEQSDRIDAFLAEEYNARDEVSVSNKLISYASQRYRSATGGGGGRALRRRLWFIFSRPPVRPERPQDGRGDSSVFFDKRFSVQDNPDVRARGINSVVHYLKWGSREGRSPSPFF